MSQAKIIHLWLKILSPLALGLGTILAMETSALASPQTFKIAQVRSRAIAPTSINITPRSGSHISLPQTNSNYYYHNRSRYRSRGYYKDCDRDYRSHRRPRRRRGITVIIDSPNYNSLPTGGNYIRVIKK